MAPPVRPWVSGDRRWTTHLIKSIYLVNLVVRAGVARKGERIEERSAHHEDDH